MIDRYRYRSCRARLEALVTVLTGNFAYRYLAAVDPTYTFPVEAAKHDTSAAPRFQIGIEAHTILVVHSLQSAPVAPQPHIASKPSLAWIQS